MLTVLMHGGLGGEEPGGHSQTLLLVLVDVLILQFAVGGDVPSPFYFTVSSSW